MFGMAKELSGSYDMYEPWRTLPPDLERGTSITLHMLSCEVLSCGHLHTDPRDTGEEARKSDVKSLWLTTYPESFA